MTDNSKTKDKHLKDPPIKGGDDDDEPIILPDLGEEVDESDSDDDADL